jgi:antitoxin component of RelBE/YafQ-DinJ toxin-antitoxin module
MPLVKTSLRIDKELLKEVQKVCIDLEITQQDAIDEAIRLWLAQQKGKKHA